MAPTSNLVIRTPSVDFTVDQTTGEAYISQTKLAELCGVTQHAISQYVSKTRDTLKLNEINQIHEDSVELVMSHYAIESQRPNETALKNYRVLAKAGIRAYLYHMAGYVMEAKPAVPQTYLDAPWGRSSLNPALAGVSTNLSERFAYPLCPMRVILI